MSTGYLFQIEGASGNYDATINGYSFTVTVKLEGVTGDTDIAQMFNALIDENIPSVGFNLYELTGIPELEGCWLRNIDATPLGHRMFRLLLTYQQSPYQTIRISSNTQTSQIETNKDRNITDDYPTGTPITLRYEYPANYGGDVPTAREEELRGTISKTQGGTYSKLIPETTRTYELREAVDPILMRDLVGTINSVDWLQTGDQYKWMLSSVTGVTDDSDGYLMWVNTYTFQYKIDDWYVEVVFVDPNTNEPVPDPVFEYENNPNLPGSIAQVDAYEQSDFNTLFPDFV